MCSGFGFAGPHTIMHHQYFKMVDLLIETCMGTTKGLNPFALPYEPTNNNSINVVNKTETTSEKENAMEAQQNKRKNKLVDENDCVWKLPSKTVNKRTVNSL